MHDFKADFAAAVLAASPDSVFGIGSAIAAQILKSAAKFNTPENRKLAKQAAKEVYDEACRVIDLPVVDGPFETTLEAAGWRSLETFLDSLLGA